MHNIIFSISAIALIILAFTNIKTNIEPEEVPKIDETLISEEYIQHDLKDPESYIKGFKHGVGLSVVLIGSAAAGYGIYKGGKWVHKKIKREKPYVEYEYLDAYSDLTEESGNVEY